MFVNAIPSRDGGSGNQRYPQRHGEGDKAKPEHVPPNVPEAAAVFERPSRIVVDDHGRVIRVTTVDAEGREVIREISEELERGAEGTRGVLVDLQT